MTDRTDHLVEAFARRSRGIEGPKLARFKEAYLRMARDARYRPGELGPGRLDQEAAAYAAEFCAEEDTDTFGIGCSDFETNRAFVWVIEAARCLATGVAGDAVVLRLLRMAAAEIERARCRA